MKMKVLVSALLGATAIAAACMLPAQAQSLRIDGQPFVLVAPVTPHEEPEATPPVDTGTSRDQHGLPAHGAWGTGATDRMTAMNRWDSRHEQPRRPRPQRMYDGY